MFSNLVAGLVFSLSPLEGLELISFCELWTTGLWTQCSRLAVLIPNTAVREPCWHPRSSLGYYGLHQCLWTMSCLQQWVQADAGGKMSRGCETIWYLPWVRSKSATVLISKGKSSWGALQHLGGGQTPTGQDTLHFQNVSRPGPVCLCVANAVISSWLRFETSQLTSS